MAVAGVGPVFAAGLVAAALLGAGGAATGAAVGGALEDSMARELPHDELFVYEDALRRGRSVVLVVADDDEGEEKARGVFAQSGAESLDAARDNWWVGLRDAEEAEYTVDGGDFSVDEPTYRRGFGSAQKRRSWAARFLTPRVCSTLITLFRKAENTTGADCLRTRQASSPSVWSRT